MVIVTGSAGGIGSAIVEAFEAQGDKVFGIDKHNCNLADDESIAFLCAEHFRDVKKIKCLVNCAGVSGVPWGMTFQVNVDAPWILSSTLKWKLEGGSIVNICSLNAHQAFPNNPAYVASKHALLGLTKALALDWAEDGIRVNSVSPGYIYTNMTQGSYKNPVEQEKRTSRTMLHRWGFPQDVVGAVLFLASDAARYITGVDIPVDGGWLAKGL